MLLFQKYLMEQNVFVYEFSTNLQRCSFALKFS